MSMYNKIDIPRVFLMDSAQKIEFEESIDMLESFSLITDTSDGAGNTFSMHRLVQLAMKRWLRMRKRLGKWESASIINAAVSFSKMGEWYPASFGSLLQFIPHLSTVSRYEAKDRGSKAAQAQLAFLSAAGAVLYGKFELAKEFVQITVSHMEHVRGLEHRDTINSSELLARILWYQGRFEEAARYFRQLLKALDYPRGLGSEKRQQVMVSLANVLAAQRSFRDAETPQREVLTSHRVILGDGDVLVLCGMCQLALLLFQQGLWNRAEKTYILTLKMNKRVARPQPKIALQCLNGLIDIYWRQHRYQDVEELLKQITQVYNHFPDILHPCKLYILDADTHKHLEETERLSLRNSNLLKENLGDEHPFALKAAVQFTAIHVNLQRFIEAKELAEPTLSAIHQVYGRLHKDTLNLMNLLAITCTQRNRIVEAIDLFEDEIQRRSSLAQPAQKEEIEQLKLGKRHWMWIAVHSILHKYPKGYHLNYLTEDEEEAIKRRQPAPKRFSNDVFPYLTINRGNHYDTDVFKQFHPWLETPEHLRSML